MTANEHDVKPEIPQSEAPPVEAETKPKRRSRAKAAPAATGADASPIAAPSAATDIKPKRRSRAKATAATSEAPDAAVPPVEAAAKPKRRSRAKGPAAAAAGNGRGALVIVESPTKAKTIGKYLGHGYTVKATVGHVRDLPKRELGVDVEHGFAPKYVTIKGKTKTLSEIKKAAKGSDRVLIDRKSVV